MPFNIGLPELAIVLVILLVIFGPKRLPEVGRSLGKGIKEFRKSTSELQEKLTEEEPAPTVQKTQPVEPAAEKLEAPGAENKAS